MLDLAINPKGFPKADGLNITQFAPGLKRGKENASPIITARQLCEMEFDAIKYAVPGYIAEGLTLFAGKPKLGKSWFCMEIGLAIATGGVCSGHDTQDVGLGGLSGTDV